MPWLRGNMIVAPRFWAISWKIAQTTLYQGALGYPWLKDHALFHGELVLKAKGVKVLCMDQQKPDNIDRCFQEMATLLIEDVVKGDLQFVSFLQDKGVVSPY
jgi:hypothetical protein